MKANQAQNLLTLRSILKTLTFLENVHNYISPSHSRHIYQLKLFQRKYFYLFTSQNKPSSHSISRNNSTSKSEPLPMTKENYLIQLSPPSCSQLQGRGIGDGAPDLVLLSSSSSASPRQRESSPQKNSPLVSIAAGQRSQCRRSRPQTEHVLLVVTVILVG
jgi:hypothetical protein